jgi:hypothetical protein
MLITPVAASDRPNPDGVDATSADHLDDGRELLRGQSPHAEPKKMSSPEHC